MPAGLNFPSTPSPKPPALVVRRKSAGPPWWSGSIFRDSPREFAFHKEEDGVKTAFEAQLIEWSKTLDQPGSTLHFTLPAEGMSARVEQLRTLAKDIGVPVEASVQDPSTDTVALDEGGRPFLKPDGTPLFRPGGHGALLHNLAAIARPPPGRW